MASKGDELRKDGDLWGDYFFTLILQLPLSSLFLTYDTKEKKQNKEKELAACKLIPLIIRKLGLP